MFFLLFFPAGSVFSQAVPKLSFEELAPFLSKNNDTTYIVNFWATWCGPCVQEMHEFEDITHRVKHDPNLKVKVYLVSLDFPEQYDSHLLPFIQKQGLISEVLFLDDGKANKWIPKVDKSWSGAIPATLIYKGSSRKFIEGKITQEVLSDQIKNFNN